MTGFNNGFTGMNNYMNFQQPMQRQMFPNNYIQNPMQNNFQDRINQGMKIVESEKNLENIDVPMDGNPYYFVKADGTEIYSKYWTPEMKTKVNKFILVNEQDMVEDSKPELDEILKNYFETLDNNLSNRIESINQNIMNLNKPIQRNNKTSKEE